VLTAWRDGALLPAERSHLDQRHDLGFFGDTLESIRT
jgi:hypothetical protein